MTTSSDRLLMRWVPLAALLAVLMAVGLSFGPHPFGFHGWPKAPAPRSIDPVVRVTPADAPLAVARREPAARQKPAHEPAAADRDAGSTHARRRHAERVERDRRRSSRHRESTSERSGSSPAPIEQPAQSGGEGGDDAGAQTPDGTPVAQAPSPLPDNAAAKPEVQPVTPPDTTVDVELDFDGSDGDGHGHGHGRHGRHGWH